MKTVVTIPDDVIDSVNELAHRLGLSREQIYVNALALYLNRHREAGVTEKLNALYGEIDSRLDPKVYDLQNRTLTFEDWEN